ncbi:MAG: hypothetical protein IJY28_08060 [Clostridia bacterium]|nr:hypothetical protein [Clostridia bacterium]
MNSKNYSTLIQILGYALAALAVVQLILMFLPYYKGTMTNEDTGAIENVAASIQSFVWVEFENFEEHFTNVIGKNYYINNYITGPITSLVMTILVLVMSFNKGVDKIITMLSGLVFGVGGIVCFFVTPLLAYGNQAIFWSCIVVFALAAVVSVVNMVFFVLDARTRVKV